jgi:hypothetical protein
MIKQDDGFYMKVCPVSQEVQSRGIVVLKIQTSVKDSALSIFLLSMSASLRFASSRVL